MNYRKGRTGHFKNRSILYKWGFPKSIPRPIWRVKTDNRARKSRTTLQNKVRLKVLPEQLTLFVKTSVTFKNASFYSFLLYRLDYCSEIHTLPCTSN